MQHLLKLSLAVLTTLSIATMVQAVPLVKNVDMQQLDNSRRIKITYDLEDEAAIITVAVKNEGEPIPDQHVVTLYGDVNKEISVGSNKEISWDAGIDWPEQVTSQAVAVITAWSLSSPPQYCEIDLIDGKDAVSYPVSYFTSSNSVPGGITHERYKTRSLLLRRIEPTGSVGFAMGSPENEVGRNADREKQVTVILQNPYYIGVYPVTQSQWHKIMGGWPSYFHHVDFQLSRPVESVSYNRIREDFANNEPLSPGWPTSSAVGPDSFMGKLRSKTTLFGFDLPTEAQWEYACRATSTGALNNFTANLIAGFDYQLDPNLDKLGRYRLNTANPASYNHTVGTEDGTNVVGSYLPNKWGLYDMHGNIWELCLDRYSNQREGETDPVGALSGDDRAAKGGSWWDNANNSRSAARYPFASIYSANHVGFRVALNIVTPEPEE